MFAMLEFAARHRRPRWIDIGYDEDSKEAARLLADRGVVEVSRVRNQYRLTPKG